MSILTNGFGIISFISVTPLIAIQALGIIYNIRLKKAEKEAAEESFADLADFADLTDPSDFATPADLSDFTDATEGDASVPQNSAESEELFHE